MKEARVRIDDREITVESGTSILRAASEAGVYIPHLCYEKSLSTKGSCRICLVEVEGNPKLQPACSTAVCDKMVIRTNCAPVIEARRAVLELLLVNHPLDCPVCDKGGECKLQDYVFRYGQGKGRFRFGKRTFVKEDIGPFVVRDMNRCIHCTRCVRFTSEITLSEDLGVFNRSDDTSVGTYLGRELRNPFSGNVTELCPVGALTDRVFRFKARVWELEDAPSTCPLCPVGCLTDLQLDEGRIVRVRNRKGEQHPWICDLGRFGFAAERRQEREPVLREGGQEISVPWEVALSTVGARFGTILRENGPQSIGVFCSSSATNEEIFTIQHVFRNVLGCGNVAFRPIAAGPIGAEEGRVLSDALRNQGRADELVGCQSMLLFCSDPCEEAPVAGLEMVRAAASGCVPRSLGPRRPRPDALSGAWWGTTPEDSAFVLASIAREVVERAAAALPGESRLRTAAEELNGFSLDRSCALTGIGLDELRSVVQEFLSAGKLGLVVGREVFCGPFLYPVLSSMLRIRASREALGVGDTVLFSLLGEGNARGALELGGFPSPATGGVSSLSAEAAPRTGEGERPGKNLCQMMEAARTGELKALFVFDGDPLSEFEDGRVAREALANLEFLVVQAAATTQTAEMAHVRLPLQDIFERRGSVLTLDGDLRALRPQTSSAGSRSLVFDVLDSLCRAVGSTLKLTDPDSALREIKRVCGWSFEESLDGLATGRGVRLRAASKVPSQTWIAAREFEKTIAAERWARVGDGRRESRDGPGADYPYTLLTGTAGVSSWAWAREISRHRSVPDSPFAELAEGDAEEAGISAGGLIDVESRAGSMRVRAVTTDSLKKGIVFVPSHFAGARANVLTEVREPVTRVRLRKASA